jgi:V8-like Glu-specific endopeptidase
MHRSVWTALALLAAGVTAAQAAGAPSKSADPEASAASAPAESRPIIPMGRRLATLPRGLATKAARFGEIAPAALANPPRIREAEPGPRGLPDARIGPRLPIGEPVRAGANKRPANYGRDNRFEPLHYSDRYVDRPDIAPQRAIGLFVFVASDNLTYDCSATLIAKSIILLAGHCVHDGNNSDTGWIKSGTFYPAYNKGTNTSLGSAKANWYTATSGWYQDGRLSEGDDVALVVLEKSRVGSSRTEIGNRTGFFGFCYVDCLQSYMSLTQLGYPSNYGRGEVMSESNHISTLDGPEFISGSGMEEGSSGGPFIANFGRLVDRSADPGQEPKRNVIFAVMSWGYDDASLKMVGASSLSGPSNSNGFRDLFNSACAKSRALHGSGSCRFLP